MSNCHINEIPQTEKLSNAYMQADFYYTENTNS